MTPQLLILGPSDRARKLTARLVDLGILFAFTPPAALPEKLPASLAPFPMIVLSEEQARQNRKRLDAYERAGGVLLEMQENDWTNLSRIERIAFASGQKLDDPALARKLESIPDRQILHSSLAWVMEQTDLTWNDVLRYHLETLLQAYGLLGDEKILARAGRMVRGSIKTRPVISNCDHVACIYPMLRYAELAGDKKLIPFCQAVADEFIANTPRYRGMLSNFLCDKGILRFEISFQVCPALARLARLTGRADYNDMAVEQILLSDRFLRDKPTGLWRVGLSRGGLTPTVWGRGCVASFRGLIDTMEELPPDHPGQKKIRPIMLRFARAFVRHQEKAGHWCQLFNDVSRRREGSVTAWSVAALAKGVRLGMLGGEFRPAIEKGWKAVKRLTWDGLSVNIAQGTTASPDPEYYRSAMFIRPTYSHFPLLAALEYEAMKRS